MEEGPPECTEDSNPVWQNQGRGRYLHLEERRRTEARAGAAPRRPCMDGRQASWSWMI